MFAVAYHPVGAAAAPHNIRDHIAALLSGAQSSASQGVRLNLHAKGAVKRFYAARDFAPAWSSPRGQKNLKELAASLRDAGSHGLEPRHYHADALDGHPASDRDRAVLDVLATDGYLTFAENLRFGLLDPASLVPTWTLPKTEMDFASLLETALKQGRVAESLAGLAPQNRAYAALRRELAAYREIASRAPWPKVPPGGALKVGATGERVAALRTRLEKDHLLAPPATERARQTFGPALEDAVVEFQRRIGLDADGIVGPLTLTELNYSAKDRVDQIIANLERWRWLPDDLGDRHVRVNIADFRLETWAGGKLTHVYSTIVGRSYRKTPVFSDRISFVEFNPVWNVPNSIARRDKLAELRKEPERMAELGFDVFDRAGHRLDPRAINWANVSSSYFPYRLVQRPGPFNALGQVKIMFPNAHNVYLHDTPTRDLFARANRSFSSGCVRVDHAVSLAEWVLGETPGWDRRHIDDVIASGRTTRAKLAHPIPVHILYFTAVVEDDGRVRFVPDLYDRDRKIIAALNRRQEGMP